MAAGPGAAALGARRGGGGAGSAPGARSFRGAAAPRAGAAEAAQERHKEREVLGSLTGLESAASGVFIARTPRSVLTVCP